LAREWILAAMPFCLTMKNIFTRLDISLSHWWETVTKNSRPLPFQCHPIFVFSSFEDEETSSGRSFPATDPHTHHSHTECVEWFFSVFGCPISFGSLLRQIDLFYASQFPTKEILLIRETENKFPFLYPKGEKSSNWLYPVPYIRGGVNLFYEYVHLMVSVSVSLLCIVNCIHFVGSQSWVTVRWSRHGYTKLFCVCRWQIENVFVLLLLKCKRESVVHLKVVMWCCHGNAVNAWISSTV
jgi:hypothetical protein